MVLTTIGFITAIAVPRLSSAADHSRDSALKGTMRNLQFAMEMYAAEHFDRSPTENADGSAQTNATIVVNRLTKKTDDNGNVVANGAYGPYLKEWPANPVSNLKTLRITAGGSAAGTHGWRIDTASRRIVSDYKAGVAVAVGGGAITPVDESEGNTTTAESPMLEAGG